MSNIIGNVPAGANGYFVRGYELLDTDYIVSGSVDNTSPVAIGTFACKSNNPNECVGQKGNGEVIGFIPFQGYKSNLCRDGNIFEAGDRVQIDISNLAIYGMNITDGVTCNKDDYIGITKADGSLVFNANKAQVSSDTVKFTGYKVVQTNNGREPGLIYIKRA